MIERFNIKSKTKQNLTLFASESDFVKGETEEVDANAIISNPKVTLYCLNQATKKALFVETPENVDLLEYPFLYQAQYKQAKRGLIASFDTLTRVANEIKIEKKPVILIHSTGRSGSTLLSNVFSELDGIASLSEPDFYTNLTTFEDSDEKDQIISDSTRILLHQFRDKATLGWAIKFRSFCMEIADKTELLVPMAKSLFLYRNISDWATSSARAFNIFDPNSTEWMSSSDPLRPKLIPLLSSNPDREYTEYSPTEFITLMWLSTIKKYIELKQSGFDLLPIDYKKLIENPALELSRIFSFTNIPLSNLSEGLRAFDYDSQQKSPLAKKVLVGRNTLSEDHKKEIRSLISMYSEISKSQYFHTDIFDI